MGNALFIIWRESAEAMLVVGILYAWLKKTTGCRHVGMRYLWGGVAAGIGLAIVLAAVMLGIATSLSGEGLEYFQLVMMFLAAGLIVQMVFWMRKHGRTFKRDLEAGHATECSQAPTGGACWSSSRLRLAAKAPKRWSSCMGWVPNRRVSRSSCWYWRWGLRPVGLRSICCSRAAACCHGARFSASAKYCSCCLPVRLLVTGVEKLIGMGLVPPLIDPLWDSSLRAGRFGPRRRSVRRTDRLSRQAGVVAGCHALQPIGSWSRVSCAIRAPSSPSLLDEWQGTTEAGDAESLHGMAGS